VFCANFATPRQHWSPRRSVWHGRCYTPHPADHFYYHVVTDDDGFDWRPLEALQRYKVARDGDNLLTPFQCDLCWFRNLQRRDPLQDVPHDTLLLCVIRHALLDALWGREPQTVGSTLRAASHMVQQWQKVGLTPPFPPLGPFPVSDSLGMSVAVAMLLKSLEPGRYSPRYQQFETVRKLRAGFSNIYMASREGVHCLHTVGGDKAKYQLTYSPTQSQWFERFSQGCVRRMGQEVRQDWAIPLPVMHGMMELLEDEWSKATELVVQEQVESLGAFALIALCGSFRGSEVFLMDLHGLRKCMEDTQRLGRDHVVVPLLGRFKGEQNSRYHLSPLASVTSSGLQVRVWVERLIEVREKAGRVRGPAFCDRAGGVAGSQAYDAGFVERLLELQAARPELIPQEVDIGEQFGLSRSFRRGSTSVARTRGLDDKYVELINRWRTVESARGHQPSLPMRDHYSDIAIMVPEMVKYSLAL
jgi:hypothetical protein